LVQSSGSSSRALKSDDTDSSFGGKRREGSFLSRKLRVVTVGEKPVEFVPENDGEQIQFAASDRERVGDLADDSLFKTAVDAVAVPGKGEAVTFATTVVITEPTGIAMVSMLPPAPPETLERQTRGGRALLLS
jgi:hypothetical protein